MLPFDQMSPVTMVFEVPWNVSELPALGQPAGLSVKIAAPLVPAFLATAVALAPIGIALPAPSTCITVTGIWWRAVTVKLTPAIERLTTVIVSVCDVASLKVHDTDIDP